MLTQMILMLRTNRDADLMKDAVGAVALVILLIVGLHAPNLV